MDNIGKFVIRETNCSVFAYRIVGYDFEQKAYIMKRIPTSTRSWKELVSHSEYELMISDDKTYTNKEVVQQLKEAINSTQFVLDVLFELQCPTTLANRAEYKQENRKNELSHLYNALDNTLCALHHAQRRSRHQCYAQAYREYTKSLHRLRKRFYFYFKDNGKRTVDYLSAVANGLPTTISKHKNTLECNLSNQKRLLMIVEDYIRRFPEIAYAQIVQ